MAMTAYGRAQARKRKEERLRRQRAKTRKAAAMKGVCGGKKKNGELCQMKAGQGTDHPGVGYCRWHGGLTPTQKLSEYKNEAIFMGAPKEINATDALVWIIKVAAGEVEWLTNRMAEIDQDEWFEHTATGRQMHILQRSRAEAMDRLGKYSKDALHLGIEERRIRLAEQYGNSIAKLLKSVLDELIPYMSQEGIKQIPVVIRKHLLLLEQGNFTEVIEPQRELERAI